MAIELESKIDYLSLARKLEKPVREAGQAILDIYHQGSDVQIKGDGSPVTKADLASEAILLPAISVAAPFIQIVSEENATSHGFAVTDRFFLVDPLDGTKEFLKTDNKGAFTVNIGLVEGGVPVMGIVYAPALDRLFLVRRMRVRLKCSVMSAARFKFGSRLQTGGLRSLACLIEIKLPMIGCKLGAFATPSQLGHL